MLGLFPDEKDDDTGKCRPLLGSDDESMLSSVAKAFTRNPKSFQDFPSHRILRHMHEALNIDKKKLITQFVCKSRDESFDPS